jgi:hypothetical protein
MFSVYAGAAALALALLAVGRGRTMGNALGILAIITLLISLGRHTPVHAVFRTVVRPLLYMRYPEKYLIMCTAYLGLLAGLGCASALDRSGPWRRSVTFLALLATLGITAKQVFMSDWAPYVMKGAIHACVAVGAVLGAQFLARRGQRLAPVILILAIAFDLAIAGWPHLDFGPATVATQRPPAAEVLLADYRTQGGTVVTPRLYLAQQSRDSVDRYVGASSQIQSQWRSMQILTENASNTFGIATLPGYDAALSPSLETLWTKGRSQGQSVLRLLGASYTILPVRDPRRPGDHRTGLIPLLDPLPGARLYRVPGTLPRVYLAPRTEVVSDTDILERVFDQDVVTGQTVLLAPSPPGRARHAVPLEQPRKPAPPPRQCKLRAFSNWRIDAECEVNQPATAVFIEQHAPEWQARVNGQSATLHRANLVMRAVRLSPGTQQISLTYAPAGVRLGALLCLVALLLLGGLALWPSISRTRC